MQKTIAAAGAVGLLIFSFAATASAHIAVRPSSVGVASFQTFDAGVPVEKNIPTVAVKILIPAGVQYVSPNVKPGWNITVTKDPQGNVSEIDWTDGKIPAGQRDDFIFSAKVPSQETKLAWKAYQTYQDGSVVSWDTDPRMAHPEEAMEKTDSASKGPYSVTSVVNDLEASPVQSSSGTSSTALILSTMALLLSGYALWSRPRT